MNLKIVALVIILTIISSATTYQIYALTTNVSREIHCPKDDSLYIWTPIGTFSENFIWRCFQNDIIWTRTYQEDAYERWLNAFLEPSFIRDYTLLYLRTVLQMEFANPLTLNWTGGRETPDGIVGYETYIYRTSGITVTVGYPVVKPENTIYTIKIQIGGRTLWEGELHHREFITHSPTQNAIYDHYGSVGLFDRGIHVIATSYNPMIRETTAGAMNTSGIGNEYWLQLKENVTLKASTEDFISIIISRGDKPTGGYTLQVNSFSWLESYPVKFRFNVDIIDPGEGVVVTEAITDPLVLVPLGKLSIGEYIVEVHIDTYVLTFDEQGNPVYTLLQTLKEETWTLTFIIE